MHREMLPWRIVQHLKCDRALLVRACVLVKINRIGLLELRVLEGPLGAVLIELGCD